MLAQDHAVLRHGSQEQYYGQEARVFGGVACPLMFSSKEFQRVAWSTSYSETNPAVSCAAMANIIASRITELEYLP
eukprot:1551435-Pyramimonas_sp.AAC.1